MRVSISFDYDSPAGMRQSFAQRYLPPDADQRGADLLLEVLAKHNVRATFAIVGNAARNGQAPEHAPDQIRRIHAGGHEIASHSMWHRYLPSLSDEQLFLEFAGSKAALEECIGAPVTGFIPPFNRPMQFLSKGAFSASEVFGLLGRGRSRQNIPSMLRQARFAGYRWCRISLHPKFKPGGADPYPQPFAHEGVIAIPVHLTGFGKASRAMLRQALEAGVEHVSIYGHPNSAIFDGEEGAQTLDGLFDSFRAEMASGQIQFCTMKDVELIARHTAPVAAGESPNAPAHAYAVSGPGRKAAADPNAPPVPVTIMIPCRNERKGIVKLLECIEAQDMTGLDWEVLIADGMSDDGTRGLIEAHCAKNPRVRLIDNPGRIVSTGLNAALRMARGEIVLRMDAHTEYAPDYVRACVDTLNATGAQNVGGPARTRSSSYMQRVIAMAYKNPFACGGARFHMAGYEGYVDTVPYGCWRKRTLLELGGFDEKLVRNQDDELNLRLTRSGGKIWQSPRIQSWYHPRDRVGRLFRQYFQYGFWKVAVIRKHRVPASVRHLIPAAFVIANLLLLLNCLLSFAMKWETAAVIGNWTWAAMLVSYALTGLLFAGKTVALAGWKVFPMMPPVFAVYHLSYGLGFLCGLLYWPFAGAGSQGPSRTFTQLSR